MTWTATGPIRQCLRELLTNLPLPIDVSLEIDRALGAANRLKHGREDLFAVAQGCDLVSRQQSGAEQIVDGSFELRIAGRILMFHLVMLAR